MLLFTADFKDKLADICQVVTTDLQLEQTTKSTYYQEVFLFPLTSLSSFCVHDYGLRTNWLNAVPVPFTNS